MWILELILIRTSSGKEGGRNTETEVTVREGYRSLNIYLMQ